MNKSRPEETVRRALDFIKKNLAQPLTVDQVARHTGCATPTLKALFGKITGKGVFAQILLLRIERAKELLKETDLEITQIAFDVGFNSLEQFTRMFKQKVGLSPSLFRRSMETALVKREKYASLAEEKTASMGALEQDWSILSGDWSVLGSCIVGKSHADLALLYKHLLPTNFSLELEIQAVPEKSLVPGNLGFGLRGEQNSGSYAEIVLGSQNNRRGEFRYAGETMIMNSKAVVAPSVWHSVRMDLGEDTIFFFLDGEQAFAFRDPFPPTYSKRCLFSISSWRSRIRFRNFRIRNLGQVPLVSVVRQGDSLYNAGLFQNAREFYARHLKESPPFSLAQELNYKIGRCDLEQNMLTEARQRLESASRLPEMDFWAQQSKLALLELQGRLNHTDELCEMIQDMFHSPFLVNGVRFGARKLANEYGRRGFHNHSFQIWSILQSMEAEGSLNRMEATFQMSTALILSGRLAEARPLLETVIGSNHSSEDLQIQSLHDLAYLCSIIGDFQESQNRLEEIRKRTDGVFRRAQCDVFHAFNLRGQKGPGQALESLEKVAAEYGPRQDESIVAQIEMMMILCALGKIHNAREAYDRAAQYRPDHPYVLRRSFRYVIPLCEGNHSEAAEILWGSGTDEGAWPCTWAGDIIKAGLLFEVAGDEFKAREIWKWATQRFPEDRIRYYGTLAAELLSRQDPGFPSMPYLRDDRSEMFYLAGLLFEKRGAGARAKELFRLSVAEDATQRWPAYLARQKISS